MAHYIDGKEYVEVDRDPEVGDYVYITMIDGRTVTEIRRVERLIGNFLAELDDAIGQSDLLDLERYIDDNDKEDEFTTLEPVEGQQPKHVDVLADTDALDDVTGMIASLATEVTKLQREVSELKDREDSNSKDLRTVSQEVGTLSYGVDELYGRLAHVEADIEVVDDKIGVARHKPEPKSVAEAIKHFYEGRR